MTAAMMSAVNVAIPQRRGTDEETNAMRIPLTVLVAEGSLPPSLAVPDGRFLALSLAIERGFAWPEVATLERSGSTESLLREVRGERAGELSRRDAVGRVAIGYAGIHGPTLSLGRLEIIGWTRRVGVRHDSTSRAEECRA